MNRWLAASIVAAAAGYGVLVRHVSIPSDPHMQWGLETIVTAWLWTVVGVYALRRRPQNRTGKLMLLVSLVLWLGPGEATRNPLLWTLGSTFEALWFPVLTYLLLSFPTGQLCRRRDWALVALAGLPQAAGLAGSFFYDPSQIGCTDCQPGLNLIMVRAGPPDWLTPVFAVLDKTIYPTIAALILVPVIMVVRWLRATGPSRRVLSPVLIPICLMFLAVAAQQVMGLLATYTSIYHPTPEQFTIVTKVAFYAAMALPLAFLFAVWQAWVQRGTRVGALIVELSETPPLDRLQRALARALGDPSLQVGRWDAESAGYLSSDGAVLAVHADDGRATTYLERDGVPLAAVVHDEALLEDSSLLDAVSAATLLAVDNERLQAALREQLEEVRASRARIVTAADAERRRLERDLHDGAQQRLVALTLDARMAQAKADGHDPTLGAMLTSIADGLSAALVELRDLARGIHPSILTDEGLSAALGALADRSLVPVRLLAVPGGRYDAAVEAAAYFTVSEALANVAKHAQATEVTIDVTQVDGRLRIVVTDDGVGGAAPTEGSGLAGLSDRIAALNGTLTLLSPLGGPTSVRGEIPCGSC